jgi:hypothetical protein
LVSYTTVRPIRDGKTWTEVTGGPVHYKVRRKWSKKPAEQVVE